jgi:transposase
MEKDHISLGSSDRLHLEELLSKGSLKARVYKRCQGLLLLDSGKTIEFVCETVGVSRSAVHQWKKRYQGDGLSFLVDKPRSGRPIEISGEERAKVTALACSDPPKGHSQWSLRLLADKAVELGLCEHLSHSHAGEILKKMNYSLTENANGVSET